MVLVTRKGREEVVYHVSNKYLNRKGCVVTGKIVDGEELFWMLETKYYVDLL